MQFKRVVLDLLPVFLDNELLLLDPCQQAAGALAVFLHFLIGQQGAAAGFFLAPAFLLRVHTGEDRAPARRCPAGGSGLPGVRRTRSAIPAELARCARTAHVSTLLTHAAPDVIMYIQGLYSGGGHEGDGEE